MTLATIPICVSPVIHNRYSLTSLDIPAFVGVLKVVQLHRMKVRVSAFKQFELSSRNSLLPVLKQPSNLKKRTIRAIGIVVARETIKRFDCVRAGLRYHALHGAFPVKNKVSRTRLPKTKRAHGTVNARKQSPSNLNWSLTRFQGLRSLVFRALRCL